MKKKILIIDDSALMRRLVCDIINADERFLAEDYAKDGKAGYEALLRTRYDAVILDINMPVMSGLELLEKLKKDKIDVNIIVVSSTMNPGSNEVLKATKLGVFDYMLKPTNFIEARGAEFKEKLLDSLAKATYVEFEQRTPAKKESLKFDSFLKHKKDKEQLVPDLIKSKSSESKGLLGNKVIALACSTGGPKALHSVIPFISRNIDSAIVLVQHMPVGFTKLLADRLNQVSNMTVKEAEDGEVVSKGNVYVAPGGFHMRVIPGAGSSHRIRLSQEAPQGGLRPYANYMFESLIDCNYDSVLCIVLTGMGADGTEGITKLKMKKKIHVIAQNKESCAVYGMPKSIVDLGLQDELVPLDLIHQSITRNVGVR